MSVMSNNNIMNVLRTYWQNMFIFILKLIKEFKVYNPLI